MKTYLVLFFLFSLSFLFISFVHSLEECQGEEYDKCACGGDEEYTGETCAWSAGCSSGYVKLSEGEGKQCGMVYYEEGAIGNCEEIAECIIFSSNCEDDEDCDDNNECTEDFCVDAGTNLSYCENEYILPLTNYCCNQYALASDVGSGLAFGLMGASCIDKVVQCEVEGYDNNAYVCGNSLWSDEVYLGYTDSLGACTDSLNPAVENEVKGHCCLKHPINSFSCVSSQGGMVNDKSCCIKHHTPGCDNKTCEDLVCQEQPFCCNDTSRGWWGEECVLIANNITLCLDSCDFVEESDNEDEEKEDNIEEDIVVKNPKIIKIQEKNEEDVKEDKEETLLLGRISSDDNSRVFQHIPGTLVLIFGSIGIYFFIKKFLIKRIY